MNSMNFWLLIWVVIRWFQVLTAAATVPSCDITALINPIQPSSASKTSSAWSFRKSAVPLCNVWHTLTCPLPSSPSLCPSPPLPRSLPPSLLFWCAFPPFYLFFFLRRWIRRLKRCYIKIPPVVLPVPAAICFRVNIQLNFAHFLNPISTTTQIFTCCQVMFK